ncbi:MAG: NAD(P)H-hydrate dehydratase [Deltaproteobacteria bacterium]|nr:NAD(P)H-hydrate dehydratase [Deltaproteobacteria bacterium]MBW2019163.1 NAD(P)H-hydrate dehydratase [Deltaproteobacteria bacterium]MBW2073966.1 NAD(P)H-hydrate dehydratase [Deltaproteobacteria bacterium]RLB81228.1 MAG: bifunctional ADP-dependent NAD(P)H-hydrate dehydratase/NAD(P)H-hydrate epimerase [Deltaproteobacteria bacterium]
MYLVTAQQMKEMDRLTIESFGIPGIVLMESAGRGAVDALLRRFPDIYHMKVGIAAGRGNNGGDGFVIARYLASNNIELAVFLLSEKQHVQGDAATNLTLLEQMGIPVHEIPDTASFESHQPQMRQYDLWVDAMLGTGLKSDVRGRFKEVIDFVNTLQKPIMAVDIPSGLDSDTGKPRGACIRATMTVTFGLPKIGQVVLPGAELVGTLEVVDIGIPPAVVYEVGPKYHLLTQNLIKASFKPRTLQAHKGTTGHLLVVAGSPGKTGAGIMTSRAAMRMGAGLVTLGIPKSLNMAMESQLTEVMTEPLPETPSQTLGLSAYERIMSLLEGKKGLAIGPGLGTAKTTQNLVRKLVQTSPVPVVIDADGLNSLIGDLTYLKNLKAPVIMTPHPGEMARLVGTTPSLVQQERMGVARNFATTHKVYLVLKGARTVVAHPDGTVFINPTGNPGMASGGMGDVLTGIIAGLIVQGLPVHEAVNAGVYLHSSAADLLARNKGPVGFLASDVIEILPEHFKELVEAPPGPPQPNSFIKTL